MHPKTGKFLNFFLLLFLGKICVPIDPKAPEDFIVAEVPTLTSVINELGGGKAMQMQKEEGGSNTPPCLQPYMAVFHQFLKQNSQKNVKLAQKEAQK